MAKLKTPPINTRCDKCKGELKSEYWINKTNNHWMIGDKDTGVDSRGNPGKPGVTPRIGQNLNWWIGDVDTGIPASGVVEFPAPESATDLFE